MLSSIVALALLSILSPVVGGTSVIEVVKIRVEGLLPIATEVVVIVDSAVGGKYTYSIGLEYNYIFINSLSLLIKDTSLKLGGIDLLGY